MTAPTPQPALTHVYLGGVTTGGGITLDDTVDVVCTDATDRDTRLAALLLDMLLDGRVDLSDGDADEDAEDVALGNPDTDAAARHVCRLMQSGQPTQALDLYAQFELDQDFELYAERATKVLLSPGQVAPAQAD